jgi:hypothetical protein
MKWFRELFDARLSRQTRVLHAVLLGLLAAACSYRVWLVVHFNPMLSLWSDPERHWLMGTHPLVTGPISAIDPIGYHLYVGLVAQLTAGSRPLMAYWTVLLTLVTPWLWYRWLRELVPGRSRTWALAGWVILAGLPSWSVIYSYFMQETLLLPLLGAALWATWRCRRKGDTGSFVLAVGIWMLAGLTRGICIPMAAVAMSWLWLTQGAKAEKAAFSMLVLLLVLVPLAGRSWYILRQISPHGLGAVASLYAKSGTETISFRVTRRGGTESWEFDFGSPALAAPPLEPLSQWQSQRRGHVHFDIDLDHGRRDWVAARDSLPPWTVQRLLWLTGDNLINLFFGPSWPEMMMEGIAGKSIRWSRWVWAPLTVLCLVWTVARRRQVRERLLPALILTWFLVQGVLPICVNEGRYRKPFEGLLIAQCLLLAAASRRSKVPDAVAQPIAQTAPA